MLRRSTCASIRSNVYINHNISKHCLHEDRCRSGPPATTTITASPQLIGRLKLHPRHRPTDKTRYRIRRSYDFASSCVVNCEMLITPPRSTTIDIKTGLNASYSCPFDSRHTNKIFLAYWFNKVSGCSVTSVLA